MARGVPITEEEKESIAAALAKKPNASFVARKTGWSFATVWRVAKWASIELTAGRQAKGYKRLSAARRRKIAAALRADPKALQREIAKQTGVSRVTVSRIEGGVRRSRRLVPVCPPNTDVTVCAIYKCHWGRAAGGRGAFA